MSRIELKDIEELTEEYSARRRELADLVAGLEAELDAMKRAWMTAIRPAADRATTVQAQLRAAIEASPELFERPRTRTIAGVKVGYTKQRGQVVIDDEAATIARIRSTLPDDQAELLIRVRESVSKTAVYDLTTTALKRLGIRIEADTDAVVIRPVDGEVDKLVDALLKDAERIEEAA